MKNRKFDTVFLDLDGTIIDSEQGIVTSVIYALKKFGIEKIGTHTLRKTFGYHVYQSTKDAAMLMDIFNHADIHITLRYIGVNQDQKDKVYNKLSYFR